MDSILESRILESSDTPSLEFLKSLVALRRISSLDYFDLRAETNDSKLDSIDDAAVEREAEQAAPTARARWREQDETAPAVPAVRTGDDQ